MRFADFKRSVHAAQLKAVKHSDYHWQIRGGNYIVNVWPTKNKFHVCGTNQAVRDGGHQLCENAMKAALEPPPIVKRRKRDQRPSQEWVGRKKKELFKAGCRQCHWCGKKFSSVYETTLEHIIPITRGGSARSSDNLTLSCERCNKAHGSGHFLPNKLRAKVTLAEIEAAFKEMQDDV